MLASGTYFTAKALVGPVAAHDAPPAAQMRPAPADDLHEPVRARRSRSAWRRICAAIMRSRSSVPGHTERGRRELGHSVQTD